MALTDKLTAIGDAIREKTGGTDLLTLDQMITEITNIQGSGNSIDFNVQARKIAPSGDAPIERVYLTPDRNKNNIWVVPIRPSSSWNNADSMRWQGYPGLVIKPLNEQAFLLLLPDSVSSSSSPWYNTGFVDLSNQSNNVNMLNEDSSGNVILSFNNKTCYPATHAYVFRITF